MKNLLNLFVAAAFGAVAGVLTANMVFTPTEAVMPKERTFVHKGHTIKYPNY